MPAKRPDPVLVYANRRVAPLALLGFSAGLPQVAATTLLTFWLHSAGASLEVIGLSYLVSLPFALKVLWAPLLDRYRLPFLGRRRGWLLVVQLALAAGLAAVALVPGGSITGALVVAAVVATLGATQDILVDAHRIDVVRDEERGAGAAAYVTGYRLAMVGALAGAAWLAGRASWPLVFAALGGAVALAIAGTFASVEPERPVEPPRTLVAALVDPLVELGRRPGIAIALCLAGTFQLGESLARPMIPVFLLRHGMSMEHVGLSQAAGLAATIAGVLAAGPLIPRLGLRAMLLLAGALAAALNAGYLVVALAPSETLAWGAVLADNLASGLSAAAFVAFLMALCDARYSATQHALLTCLLGLVNRAVGGASGWGVSELGWPAFFAITIVLAAPALALAALLPATVTARSRPV